jgi:hypothetical protein
VGGVSLGLEGGMGPGLLWEWALCRRGRRMGHPGWREGGGISGMLPVLFRGLQFGVSVCYCLIDQRVRFSPERRCTVKSSMSSAEAL